MSQNLHTKWLRPQLKATTPLAGETTLRVSREAFLDFTNTGFRTVDNLERIRNAVSITAPLNKQISFVLVEAAAAAPPRRFLAQPYW